MTETEHGLGRIPQWDERNTGFPVRSIVGTRAPRSYTWGCPVQLDQGREGACVGFAWAAELAARPVSVPGITAEFGRSIYREAQRHDPWPGEEPEFVGTSVLAGVQVLRRMGYVDEYRWAFGAEELAAAVGWAGPAVIGVDWHAGMRTPDDVGYIRPTGPVIGGHAICVRGYNVKARRFLLHNSWGPRWGRGGTCFLDHDDMAELLARPYADACIPVSRRLRPA